MTKYNFLFKQQIIEFYLQMLKIIHLPTGIFKLPKQHQNVGLTNLIIVESIG